MVRPPVFTEAAQLLLSGRLVNMALGVKMELRDETVYYRRGGGTVVTNDGIEWFGLGILGDIQGLDFSPNLSTDPLSLRLSGLELDDRLPGLARQQHAEMRGRLISVYALLFNEYWQPVDMPYLCQMATIDNARLMFEASSTILEVTAEPLFSSKHLPPLGLVTDADQRSRYPGDRIFDRSSYPHAVYWNQ